MPKFANTLAWQQAELLMQPVFIRIIDNIRKQLDESSWKGTYEDVQVWSADVPEAIKAQVVELQQQLATASPEEAEEIHAVLDRLPKPHPGYLLCLEKNGQRITIDLWELCYQICFRNYSPVLNALDRDLKVEVDTTLIDETGDVDWQQLDEKAKRIVGQIFGSLPGAATPTEQEV
jgi:hypothetical protein